MMAMNDVRSRQIKEDGNDVPHFSYWRNKYGRQLMLVVVYVLPTNVGVPATYKRIPAALLCDCFDVNG